MLVFGPRDHIVLDAEGMFVGAVIVDGVAAEFALVDEELSIAAGRPGACRQPVSIGVSYTDGAGS